jgi:predicted tellurium resistance membrane protein TerC
VNNMESLLTFDTAVALLSLTGMEIILGIDNIVFIAILVAKLPKQDQGRIRSIGISLALIIRLGLLFSISWIMSLTHPLFNVLGKEVSGRDLILLLGGLFLIGKSTYEIHDKLESGSEELKTSIGSRHGAMSILIQILLLDIVFSLDSVITAVGMIKNVSIMVTAMIISVGVMLLAGGAVGAFVHRHPTIKMLALSFLLLIGVMLFGEGMGAHISKGYIYFAMAFSLSVESLNIIYRKKQAPIQFHEPRPASPQRGTVL